MKLGSKLVAIVSTVALIACSVLPAGMMVATAANEDFVATVGSVSGAPGDDISVPISITTNNGIWAFDFELSYDTDILELSPAVSTPGVLNTQFSPIVLESELGKITVQGMGNSWTTNYYDTGLFCNLLFHIKDTAESGTTTFTPTFKPSNIIDIDMNNISTRIDVGTITIHKHNYSVNYSWDDDYCLCTGTATCAGCSDVITEIATATSTEITAATCLTVGKTRYTATFENTTYFTTQTVDVDAPDAAGHNYTSISYVWSDDCTTCTATASCANCSDVISETSTASSVILTAATATEAGTMRYTATFANTSVFTTQTRDKSYTQDTFEISVGSVSGIPGEQVEVPVIINANTGIWAFQINVHYDTSILTFVSCAPSAMQSSITCLCAEVASGNVGIQGESVSFNNASSTGLFCTLTFEINSAATNTANLTTTYAPNNMIKADGSLMDVTVNPGEVALHTHNYVVSYAWASDNSTCTATATCSGYPDHTVTETVTATSAITVQPTCTTKGTHTYTATFDNALFSTQVKTAQDINALNHDYTVSYSWAADGSSCTATATCQNDSSHVVTETKTATSSVVVQATCITKGTTRYTATFDNSLFSTQTKDIEDIDALNHNYTVTYNWSADGSSCTGTATCQNDASHVVTQTVSTTSTIISGSTCVGNGTTRYTATFTKPEFTTQIKDIEDIAAPGHDYVITYSWANDGSSCTANAACKNCSDVVSENGSITNTVKVSATCTTKGTHTYTATFGNPLFSTQTKDIEDIEATDHDYVISYNWASDGSACTATATCKNDASHVVTQNATITNTVTIAATCEGKGTHRYTATFANTLFSTQTKDIEDIEATDHDYVISYNWASDGSSCTATATCQNDGSHVVTETKTATSSVFVPATCTAKGTTRYTAIFDNSLFSTQTKDIEDIDALNHNYTVTYNWATDGSSCTANAVCQNDGSHTVTETVSSTSEVITGSSCVGAGTTRYTATFTKPEFTTQTKDIDDIGATGHDYVITYTWAADGSSCTATAVCSKCTDTVTENGNITNSVTVAATCEGKGTHRYTATFANVLFSAQIKDIEDIDALNHNYTVTYNWATDGSTCTATATCQNDASHIVTETKAATSSIFVPATCTTKGTTRYTAIFDNSLFTTQTKDIEDIDALNHNYTVTYNWATDGSSCTATAVCQNDGSHTVTETVSSTSEIITGSSCVGAGTTRYTAAFTKPEFSTQTKDIDDIGATGHDYVITYTWATDGSSCTATAVCSKCTDTVTENGNVTNSVTVAATCEGKGTHRYTATFANALFSVQNKDIEDIDALNHNYTVTYNWAADGSSCTATAVCQNDGSHIVTETVSSTSEVITGSSCVGVGTTRYTATFTKPEFTTQTKDIDDIGATGHDYVITYTWAADGSSCTATAICSKCTDTVTENGNITNSVTVAATCEGKGTHRYTATFANVLFSAQIKDIEDIDALNHNYTVTYNWATDGSSCTATAVCQNDGSHIVTETVSSTSEVITGSSCVGVGTTRYTATFTKPEFSTQTKDIDDIGATGHDYVITYTWAADGSSCTATAVCSKCTDTVVENGNVTNSITVAATCEGKGTHRYTATFANVLFSNQIKDIEDINALNHNYVITYTWSANGSTCIANATCTNDGTHVVTETASAASATLVQATCTTKGTTRYTANFENSLFSTQIKDIEDIAAINHDWAITYTWSADGHSCQASAVCRNDSSHVVEENSTASSEVLVPPTCEDKGTTKYTAVFVSSLFTTQTKELEDIDALLHDYVITYTWSANGSTCVAKAVCKNDATHIVTENATVSDAVIVNATCEGKGTTEYTATFVNALFTTQTKELENIDALQHNYVITYDWSDDGGTCTATATCQNDGSHVVTENATVTSNIIAQATCEDKGTTRFTALFTNTLFTTQTNDINNINALNHNYVITYSWSANGSTCIATAICQNDGTHIVTETGVVTSAVTTEATCESKGETTYTATFENDLFATQTKVLEDIAALNHDYEFSYNWDGANCLAIAFCRNDSSHNVYEEVTATSTVKVAATCESVGTHTYTATFENPLFTTQTRDLNDIPALNHDYRVSYAWSTDGSTCKATATCQNDPTHIITENGGVTGIPYILSTCEEKGTTRYTAVFTNPLFSTQTKDIEDLPALNHNYTISYEWATDGSSCTATAICINDPTHEETETAVITNAITVAATCEGKGTHRYTATFTNSLFSVQTKDIEDIDALDHDYEIEYVWALDGTSCTATATCKNDPTHIVTEAATMSQVALESHPATCTEMGTTRHIADFTNSLFERQTKDVVDIPVLGHNYVVSYNWSTDGKTCIASAACDRCSDVFTETVTSTGTVLNQATCEGMGTTRYTASFTNTEFTTQTKDVEDIPATDHDYLITYSWNADNSVCTATATCKNNPSHVVEEISSSTSEVGEETTCVGAGSVVYTAAFVGDLFTTQTKTVEGSGGLGHDYVVEYQWSADGKTCTAVATCSRCSDTVTENGSVSGATYIAQTCDIMGTTRYTVTFTNTVLFTTQTKDVQDIPVLGHNYAVVYDWSADGKTCTATATCQNDNTHVIVETVTATGTVKVSPTCEAMGTTTYTATFDDEAFTTQTNDVVDIPAINHDYVITYVWSSNNGACVAKAVCQNDPSHVVTENVSTSSEVKVQATCETMGTTTYTANFTNALFETQTKDVVDIAALNHNYTITYSWATDGSSCTATAICQNDASHVITETVNATGAVKTQATCEGYGTTTYTANFENTLFSTQTKDINDINPINHNYVITYQWSSNNATCLATATCQNDASHVITENVTASSVIKTNATCETMGTTTYTANFTNTLFETQSKDVQDIAALNHNYSISYVWTADGSSCTATATCQNDDSHVITEVANATGTVKVQATCETVGTTTYTANFENTLFTTQIKDVDDIEATDHDYVITYQWSSDYSTCVATAICQNDPTHIVTETATSTSEVGQQSTCVGAGSIIYTVEFANPLFTTLTKPVQGTGGLGHDYVITYEWAEDGSSCIATAICSRCSDTITGAAAITHVVKTNATCEGKGTTTYTATFINDMFATQIKDIEDIDPIEHNYQIVYTWSANGMTCIATATCQNDETHVVTETVSSTSTVKQQATCETKGTTTYTASFESNLFETQVKDIDDIAALNHDYVITYEWAEDGSSCTATATCQNDASHVVTETAVISHTVKTAATCEEKGTTTYTATFTNTLFTTKTKEIEDIDALEHNYVITYTWSTDNSTCIATATCQNDPTHIVTETATSTSEVGQQSTCVGAGSVVYTANFTNALFTTQTKTVQGEGGLGHDYVVTYEWAADGSSCTATAVCSRCTDTVTETGTITHVVKTNATCETIGTTTYTALFTNELFTTQVKDIDDIAALNHNYTIVYSWSADGTSCSAMATCANDPSHVVSETVASTSTVKTAATCEAKGTTTYTATFTNELFATQIKDIDDIAALNHDYVITYEWAEDGSSCTATATCQNDASHVITETVASTSTVKTAATCEVKGTTTYTAQFTNELFVTQIKDIDDIAALNHNYTIVYNWSADGTSCSAIATCANDPSHIISESATITHEVYVEPTEQTMGTTRYTASFENSLFATQIKDIQDIAVIDHTHDYVITYEWAQDGSTCTATASCKNCENVVTETVNCTSTVKQQATCEGKGTTTYTAIFTKALFATQVKDIDDIPAINHNYVVTYQWSADGKTCTATATCQNDDTHIVTEAATVIGSVKQQATCEGKGTTTYTATFTNALFATQYKDVEDIPAINHNYAITYQWSADGKSCTAVATCQNDATHVITQTGTVTSLVKQQPTCETKGTHTYTATFANALFATQYKDVQDINALNHDYTITYQWSDDGKSCTAKAVCKNDATHVITQSATITSEVVVDPTMTTMGTTKYTATFANAVFATQTKEVVDVDRTYTLGDVNSDGEVDMKDVLMLRKKIASRPIDEVAYNPLAADANVDGKTDMKDVLVIRKYIAKLIPALGPGVV